jgi:hypothetical protein
MNAKIVAVALLIVGWVGGAVWAAANLPAPMIPTVLPMTRGVPHLGRLPRLSLPELRLPSLDERLRVAAFIHTQA